MELSTKLQTCRAVHLQDAHGRAAGRRPSHERDLVPPEVIRPCVFARVEEHHDLPCFRIDPCQVWSLVQVALMARKREVLEVVTASVLPWDHVLDVKPDERKILLVETAILATVLRSAPDRCA